MFLKMVSLAGLLGALWPQSVHAQLSDRNEADYQRFIARELCVVTGYLNALGQSDIDRNQYLIIAPDKDASQYVQCLFRLDEEVLCEASSYYYRNRRNGPKLYRLSSEKRSLLESYRFTFRPRGNFYIEIERPKDDDYEPLARFMLTILYEAYDVRFLDSVRVEWPKTIDAVRIWRACDNPHIQLN